MSEVLVRNLDEAVVEQLKTRARGNGRSLQAELKLVLEQAARPETPRPSRAEYRELAERVRAILGDRPQADSATLLAEDRAR
jgi:antitoxin FitA